ncbi:MAG TPA: PRC and DUF2382 domain-containing protein [Micromonosporaceae bacterium]
MIAEQQIPMLLEATAYDRAGNKIGKVGQVYIDDHTGQPEWITVNTGLFGTGESFVPVEPVELRGDSVVVPFDKEKVKAAPHVEPSAGHMSEQQEEELFRYYGMTEPGYDVGGGIGDLRPETAVGRDVSGPTTDDAMTRSEERLRVGTASQEVGQARLRKYVVTEHVQQTVPVSHEEVRIEREPITESNVDRAMSGPEISEEEHEVTLHEERPVVAKETVPVERVRLTKETVAGEETVGGDIRKEQIESEGLTEKRQP